MASPRMQKWLPLPIHSFEEVCCSLRKGGEGFTFKPVKVCENMEKCQNSRFMWMLQRREFYSILGKYYWKKFKLYKGLIQHKNHWGYDLEVVESPSQICIPLLFRWKRLVFLSFSAKQQPRLCISQWTMVYELLWPLSQLLVSVFPSKRGSPTNITI